MEGPWQTAGTDPNNWIVADGGTTTDTDGFNITEKERTIFEDLNANVDKDPNEPGIPLSVSRIRQELVFLRQR